MEPATSTPVGAFEIQKGKQETVIYHLKGHAATCPLFLKDFYQNEANIEDNRQLIPPTITSQSNVNNMEVQDLRTQILSLKCQLQRVKLACKQAKNEVFTLRKELDMARRKMCSAQQRNKENMQLSCKGGNEISTCVKVSILTSQLMKSESSRELYADATEQLLRFVKMTKDSLESKCDIKPKENESTGDRVARTTSWLGFSQTQRKAMRASTNANDVCNHGRIVREAEKLLSSIGKLMELDRKLINQGSEKGGGPVTCRDEAVCCTNEHTKSMRCVPPGTRTYRNLVNREKQAAQSPKAKATFTISTLV